MRTALITTTVNVPHVLALYRKLDPDVRFFVAGDRKTPQAAYDFCDALGNCVALRPTAQTKWKCSELISWDNDSRRDIALLEALQWGADIVVSVDDDMVVCSPDFFERIETVLTTPYSGLQFGRAGYWCDAGQFTVPPARQRGLPLECETHNDMTFVSGASIGALQGIILGVPDTDSLTMYVSKPQVLSATDVLHSGLVMHPEALGVFNSQFSAFRRELAPAFAQFYKWQNRNTDIIASVIMRRIMRVNKLYTYFGLPTGYHARTARNPVKEFKAELFGLEQIQSVATVLERMDRFAVDKSIVRQIYEKLATLEWWPERCAEAAFAFLDDAETTL